MTPYTDYAQYIRRLDRRRQLRAVLYVVAIAVSFAAVAARYWQCK